jgi:hypothetical protein
MEECKEDNIVVVESTARTTMPLTPTPVPSPLASFWRISPHKLDRHRSTDELPATTDVVIIGGGFAGACIAHHLLRKSESAQTRHSILILEAREACSGATGRNGAQLTIIAHTCTAALCLTSRRWSPKARSIQSSIPGVGLSWARRSREADAVRKQQPFCRGATCQGRRDRL